MPNDDDKRVEKTTLELKREAVAALEGARARDSFDEFEDPHALYVHYTREVVTCCRACGSRVECVLTASAGAGRFENLPPCATCGSGDVHFQSVGDIVRHETRTPLASPETSALLRCSARGCGWNNKTPDKQPGDACDRVGCLGVYRLAEGARAPSDPNKGAHALDVMSYSCVVIVRCSACSLTDARTMDVLPTGRFPDLAPCDECGGALSFVEVGPMVLKETRQPLDIANLKGERTPATAERAAARLLAVVEKIRGTMSEERRAELTGMFRVILDEEFPPPRIALERPPFDDVAGDAEKRARARLNEADEDRERMKAEKYAAEPRQLVPAHDRDAAVMTAALQPTDAQRELLESRGYRVAGMRCQMHGDFSGMFCPRCHPVEAARELNERADRDARAAFTLRLVEQLLALHPNPERTGVRELTTTAVVAAVEFGERRAAAPEHLRPAMFPTPEEFAERMMRCYDSAQVTLDPTGAWHLDAPRFREYVARTYALTVFGTRDPVAQKMCAASSGLLVPGNVVHQPAPSTTPFANVDSLYKHLRDRLVVLLAPADRETFKMELTSALIDFYDRKIDVDVMQHAQLLYGELLRAPASVNNQHELEIIARAILTVRDACLLSRPEVAPAAAPEIVALERRADNVRVAAAGLIDAFSAKFWESRMRTHENTALGKRIDKLRADILALRPEDC